MQAPFTHASLIWTWMHRFGKFTKCFISFVAKLTLELTLCFGCEGAVNREMTLGILLIIVAFAMHLHSESQPHS